MTTTTTTTTSATSSLLSEFGIPPDATIECPSSIPSAVLTFGTKSSSSTSSTAGHDDDDDNNTNKIDDTQQQQQQQQQQQSTSMMKNRGSSNDDDDDDDGVADGNNNTIVISPLSHHAGRYGNNALVVGRQPSTCDIRIAHKSLSRQHAVLYYRPRRRRQNNTNETNDNHNNKIDIVDVTTTTTIPVSANANDNVGTKEGPQQQQDEGDIEEEWDLYIHDLNTKTGTYVNQQKIITVGDGRSNNNNNNGHHKKNHGRCILQHGDTIQFGKAPTIFTVQWTKLNTVVKEQEEEEEEESQSSGDGKETATTTTNNPTTATTDHVNNNKMTAVPLVRKEEKDEVVDDNVVPPLLSGRAQRQAEIAAMMASFDEVPTYTKHVPKDDTTHDDNDRIGVGVTSTPSGTQKILSPPTTTAVIPPSIVQTYKLPLTESTAMVSIDDDYDGSSTDDHHRHRHHNTISCIGMDPTGARFAVGGMDSSLRLYDFGGYNIDRRTGRPVPFQNVIVQDGYPIRCISYSPMGERVLVGTGSSQPMLLSRDGEQILQFVRGDVYVTDPSKTIGHTATVTCVGWHPMDKSITFTTSRDGSLRSWNVDKGKLSFGMLTCSDVVVIKNLKTGRKTIPTCLTVSSTINLAMGTECGSIQIYKYPFVSKLRPQQSVQAVNDGPVISVIYSVDSSKLASRTEHTVHVWDTGGSSGGRLSTSSKPWMVCSIVHDEDRNKPKGSQSQTTTTTTTIVDVDNCTPTMAFSPNGKVLCIAATTTTTTTKTKKGAGGKGDDDDDNGMTSQKKNVFYSTIQIFVIPPVAQSEPMKAVYTIPLNNGNALFDRYPVSGLVWHTKLNQLLLATNGGYQIHYSTDWSKKGILLSANRIRSVRENHGTERDLQELYERRAPPQGSSLFVREEDIITPNALPLFGGDRNHNRKRKKKHGGDGDGDVDEDTTRHIPQKPPGRGVYETQNTLFTQLIMDTTTSTQKQIAGRDPREALAMYNVGRSYIGKAYEGNVERILTEKTIEQEEEEMKKKKKK